MQIVVNHLTRMKDDRICAAGIELDTMEHVRPVTRRGDRLTRRLLAENGGPLELAALVDIGNARPRSDPPQTEDQLVSSDDLAQVRVLDGDEYLHLLESTAQTDLDSAFGPALERRGRTYAIGEGRGHASLAVVKASRRAWLEVDHKGKLRLRFPDARPDAYLSVADIRFVEADHSTVRADLIHDVARRLWRGVGAYVMLGLTRAFTPEGDDRGSHWLQVNGLCLEDRPVGRAP